MTTRIQRPLAVLRTGALILFATLGLQGCITFTAGSNVDLAEQIERKNAVLQSAAEADGVDVEAALMLAPEDRNDVQALLAEADELAGEARLIADHSLRVEQLNFATLDDAARQERALDAVSAGLGEFENHASMMILEAEKLAIVDQKIMALEGYTDCGGSEFGTASCIADIGVHVVNGLGYAGISLPFGPALSAFALGMSLAGEIDAAIKRGQYFDERRARIDQLQYWATDNMVPAFENLKSTMENRLGTLEPHLQPPGWQDALRRAEQKVNSAMAVVDDMDGLFDRYKEEAEDNHSPPLPGWTPEQMAERTGEPVERFMEPEKAAFKRFWEDVNTMADDLQSAIVGLREVRDNLEAMMEINQAPNMTAAEVAALDPDGERGYSPDTLKTEQLRLDNEELAAKLNRMEQIEREMADHLSNYQVEGAGGAPCPVAL